MLKTSTILLLTGLFGSLALGCDKASKEQQDAVNAQVEANRQVAAATNEARDKAVKAQAAADKDIANAQANFMKMREDYRHETTKALVELDKEIAELDAEGKTLSGQKRTDLETKLASIRTMRAQFSDDYADVQTASASTWDATKARLEQQRKQVANAVDNAH